MNPIVVIVPTLHRPESLARALRSIFAQDGADTLLAEIVVVDNSPEGSAGPVVETLRPQSRAPLIYVHAERPGVATARNAGLAASRAPLVAFLDDDEEAPPHWLGALRRVHQDFGADVTFGAVRGSAPDARPQHRAYLERFFSRTGPADAGLTDELHGCGNAMMTRATVLAGPEPFEVAADQTGGEDDRLFTDLKTAGGRFAWAPDAWVTEHAPPERAHARYALARAIGFGQAPSQMAARRRAWAELGRWMAVGAAQTAVFGACALALWLLGRPDWLRFADRTAQGLGKLVWFTDLHFYGAAAVRRRARRAQAELPATAYATASPLPSGE